VSDPRDEEIRRLRARVAKLEANNEESLKIAEESTKLLQQVAGQRDDYARQVAVMGRWLDRNITLEDAMAHALGRILDDALAAPNAWEREVVVGSPDGTKRTARFSVAWADGESLHALLARAREERDAAQADARGWRAECDGMMEGIMRKECEVADALQLAAEARVLAVDAMREGLATCDALRWAVEALGGQCRQLHRGMRVRKAAIARQRRDAERFRVERNALRDAVREYLDAEVFRRTTLDEWLACGGARDEELYALTAASAKRLTAARARLTALLKGGRHDAEAAAQKVALTAGTGA